MMHGYWAPFMAYGWIFWLAIVIIAALLIYRVSTARRMRHGEGTSLLSPLDILKRRYAKGEISRDDFERMKKEIQDS